MSYTPGPIEIAAAQLQLAVHCRNEAAAELADERARRNQEFALRMRRPIDVKRMAAAAPLQGRKRQPSRWPVIAVAVIVMVIAVLEVLP